MFRKSFRNGNVMPLDIKDNHLVLFDERFMLIWGVITKLCEMYGLKPSGIEKVKSYFFFTKHNLYSRSFKIE